MLLLAVSHNNRCLLKQCCRSKTETKLDIRIHVQIPTLFLHGFDIITHLVFSKRYSHLCVVKLSVLLKFTLSYQFSKNLKVLRVAHIQVFAEMIATYLLVFVTCGSGALSENDENKVAKLGASVAGGLIVTVMIYAVGHISGAHMNPAVTLAFAAFTHLPWKYVRYLSIFFLYFR